MQQSVAVGAAWIRPTSTDPDILVDRNTERKQLFNMLTEYLEQRRARILITGDRGVGKSVLTRSVLSEFASQNPDRVARVIVNGRGVGFGAFVKELALGLIEAVRPLASQTNRRDVERCLEELGLLANYAQITSTQTDTIARKYGAEAGAEASLFVKLSARLSWDETRSIAQTSQRVVTVTDDLIRAAIGTTLELIDSGRPKWMVAIFFDDLDQAFEGSDGGSSDAGIQKILELQPCVAIAHIRTEAMTADVRRVIDEELEVRTLPPAELMAILKGRIMAGSTLVQNALNDGALTPFRQLAQVDPTPTPLAFLRWVHAMLRLWGATPPADWRDDSRLRELAFQATPTGGTDPRLILELAQLVDECQIHPTDGCRWDDLTRGCPSTHASPPASPPLKAVELHALVDRGLLIRRDRFASQPSFRLEPTLELLRPSVAKKLRAVP